MTLEYHPYPLQLQHTFTVSGCSRSQTPDVLLTLRHGPFVGHGEASMPPYLGESIESVCAFISRVDMTQFDDPLRTDEILDYVMHLDDADACVSAAAQGVTDELKPVQDARPHNFAAKAALDIALHDLVGQMLGQPVWRLFGLSPERCTYTTYTIGIDTPEVVRQKVREVEGRFGRLKVKVGVPGDRELIRSIRSVTDLPLTVDANQGWTDPAEALEQIKWLAAQGVIMVEQPLPKHDLDGLRWLTERSPLPIILDESVQGPADVLRLRGCCHGINIKLMKCGGLAPARLMIELARLQGMLVMLGCMTETTCAVTAAAQLAPYADYLDLDGNLLISNDPFQGGMQVIDGKVTLQEGAGLGIG